MTTDDLTSANEQSLRQTLLDWVASVERKTEPGLDRLALLKSLLGEAMCRRLGFFRLPHDFLLTVVMPVFNEVATVERVITRVLDTGLPIELILIDDGSTDGTRDELERLAEDGSFRLLTHSVNRGKGAAIKLGLAEARGNVVVIQDADLEYDPQDFLWLLQPIIEDRADVVYGSRFNDLDCPVSPLWHRWANQFITTVACLALGMRFTDVETCYKVIRRELLDDIVPTLRENRFGIEIELTFKLARKKARFYERPIRYDRRGYADGKKIGWRDGVAALWCILKYWAR